jgi:hypothetical protein
LYFPPSRIKVFGAEWAIFPSAIMRIMAANRDSSGTFHKPAVVSIIEGIFCRATAL